MFSGHFEPFVDPFHHGMRMALATLLLTVLLEVISFRTVRDLTEKQANGRRLYVKAVVANIANHFFLGVPIYMVSERLFCSEREEFINDSYGLASLARVMVILIMHSIGYFFAHKAMHTVPGLYKYHAFHHRFKAHIPPSAANAVSPVEYIVAYILPFAVGAVLARPSSFELQVGVSVVSVSNLLVHMPAMECLSAWFEPVFVSASSHKQHHKVLTCNYAAPTWNIDYIWSQCAERTRGVSEILRGSNLQKID